MKVFNILLFGIIMSTSSCDQENTGPRAPAAGSYGSGGWSIPYEQVYDGGPGKDGIPALSNPDMVLAEEATWLSDEDLVIGTLVDGEPKAYPHIMLDWHEIINDQSGDQVYTINYCPLTGTGMNWKRNINGSINTFGVSGLLYNSNLILYDRDTDSNWSQMQAESVHGRYIGRSAELLPLIETTLGYLENYVSGDHGSFGQHWN